MGCVLPAGLRQCPARQAALGAGLTESSGALTLNKVCGSGMRTVMMGANDIRCGEYFFHLAIKMVGSHPQPPGPLENILSFLDTFMPSLKDSVELYEGREPIFDAYNLEGDISRALKRKVWLKSGGYIVIEHTEALVAIDVNTGRYVGKHNLEETITKTNLEAEAARIR